MARDTKNVSRATSASPDVASEDEDLSGTQSLFRQPPGMAQASRPRTSNQMIADMLLEVLDVLLQEGMVSEDRFQHLVPELERVAMGTVRARRRR